MKKAEFQREIRDLLVSELENEQGEASVARMQELSRKALQISDELGDEIPDEKIDEIRAEFSEISRETRGSTEGPEAGMSGMSGMRK